MDADELVRTLGVLRKAGDRQRRGVGGEDGIFTQHGLDLLRDLLLDGAVLEDGLDDEVGIGKARIVRRRGDEGQQRLAVLLRHAALADGARHEAFGNALALVGGRLVAVDEDDRDAGGGGDIGDGGAHEAGADDGDLLELRFRNAGRAACTLAELLHGDEQRPDHREGFGRLEDMGEVALLDPQPRLERHLKALIDAFEDGERTRIVAGGLAAQDRGGCRPELGGSGRPDAAAGGLEALFVPRLDGLEAVLDHLLRRRDELVGLDHLMDEVHRLGARARQRRAGGHHLEGVLRIGEARHALGATGPGEDADLDLGKRDLDRLGVGGDTAVAGKRHFERAAHAGAVDG